MTNLITQTKEQFLETQSFILSIYKDACNLSGQEFINKIINLGFTPDWDLKEYERATMRIAIKRALRTLNDPYNKLETRCADMIQEVIGIYRHALHN